jgi:hypothetical protein
MNLTKVLRWGDEPRRSTSGMAAMGVRRQHLYLVLALPAVLVIARAFLSGTHAQGIHRAGLVVRMGDGSVISRCVAFSEAEISGCELLMQSGLEVTAARCAVCDIEGQSGCPVEDCFCQCRGTPCLYWSYWHLRAGGWHYAAAGASASLVHSGDVQGWSWGTGEPPLIFSFDQICSPIAVYLPLVWKLEPSN